jgi:S-DNA-T family DNA segregation ATPase FtsK/SpoIIIE
MELIQDFNSILQSFKIKATCVDYKKIDNYFYYEVKLGPNGRVKDIQKFGDEISLALKTPCKPSMKVLHQEGVVRLEFISPREQPLRLFDLFSNRGLPKGEINCLLGRSVDGQRVWMDLAQNPHMLVAGTTGSGKSTLLHNIIANLLNYNDVQTYLIDPKNIEFCQYDRKIPSIKVLYTYDEAVALLVKLIDIMESRYAFMRMGKPASELKSIVVVIDEFADLILQDQGEAFYLSLCRLAQKSRAAKIHIVLATQRPSVNVINGTIKANFPARIACRVASHVDSKVILDSSGAENLLGKGDAMLRDNGRFMERFQIAYTDATEVCSVFGGLNASAAS